MLNLGYVELACGDNDVIVRVYYDATLPPDPSQPLINGPRGYCLDLTNNSGRAVKLTVTPAGGSSTVYTMQQGNPVTTGQVKSSTVNQVNNMGFSTRGDVIGFQLTC
jgi:hypothetical protein